MAKTTCQAWGWGTELLHWAWYQKIETTGNCSCEKTAKETGWLWFAVSINFPVEHFYRKLKNKANFILISSDGLQILNTSN